LKTYDHAGCGHLCACMFDISFVSTLSTVTSYSSINCNKLSLVETETT